MKVKWTVITCKNCGRLVKTKIGAELCSYDCIREWMEEERFHQLHKDDAEKNQILEESQ